MIQLERFSSLTLLKENDKFLFYKAHDEEYGRDVLIKMLRQGVHTFEDLARFEHEFELASELELKSALHAFELIESNNTMFIVYEYIGHHTLRDFMARKKIELNDFFIIAKKLIQSLADLHMYRTVHKDLAPEHIFYNCETGELKISNFASAEYSYADGSVSDENMMLRDGTLSYSAPEQTGRMNRPVDYRCDYYSAGIIFYEILVGQVPFLCNDPLELIHAHIATAPKAAHELDTKIPRVVSAIVSRLLEKTPERRYQSASGLLADIRRCEEEYQSAGYVQEFELGSEDFAGVFQLSRNLVGRERELSILKSSFDWVKSGHLEMVLVSGASGLGKTALIKELDRYAAEFGGLYLTGYCDRFHRNTPYYCIKTILRNFAKQLNTQSGMRLKQWKEQILESLGDDVVLLLDMVPEFEHLFADLLPSDLSELEREIRYQLILQNLFSVMGSKEHPLVLVVEDVHWIDSAALNFLHLLMLSKQHSYIQIIVTSRTEELTDAHPFVETLVELQSSAARIVQTLKLEELSKKSVTLMISQTLACGEKRASELTDEIYIKAGGNPFFINELLQILYSDGVFQFDNSRGEWIWNHHRVKEKSFSKNIIDLMSDKIRLIDNRHKEPLIFASCIGSSFSLEILAEICRRPKNYILESMRYAISEGIVRNISGSYEFTHERIRQAASTMLSEEQRQVIHRQIGLYLLDRKQDEIEKNFFTVVNHFNYSIPLIVEDEEKLFLANLNLEAGKLAKESAAYKNSYRYFQTGVTLLCKSCWNEHYDIAYSLHKGAAESAILAGELLLVDGYIKAVIEHSDKLVDKAEIYNMKIRADISANRLKEAIDSALSILSLCKITFPAKPKQIDFLVKRAQFFIHRVGGYLAKPASLAECSDPLMLAVSNILSSVTLAALTARLDLYPLFVLKHLEVALKHGSSPHTPQVLAEYAFILSRTRHFHHGLHFGRAALRLSSHEKYTKVRSRVTTIVYGLVVSQIESYDTVASHLKAAHKSGIEVEDFEFAAFAAYLYCVLGFFKSKNVEKLLSDFNHYTVSIDTLGQRSLLSAMEIFQKAVLLLVNKKRDKSSTRLARLFGSDQLLHELHYNEEQIRQQLLGTLCYIYSQVEDAFSFLNAGDIKGMRIGLFTSEFLFYRTLSSLALYAEEKKNGRQSFKKGIESSLKIFSQLAKQGACNSYRYHFLKAEHKRADEHFSKAEHHYERALEGAVQNQLISDVALINERMGSYYFARGKLTVARSYIQDAYYNYQRWGARAKADDLALTYPEFIQRTKGRAHELDLSGSQSLMQLDNEMDFSAIFKASQAISGTINYEELIRTLLKIIMEHSGAGRGCLILVADGSLHIEAESLTDTMTETFVLPRKIEGDVGDNLPLSVINYVARVHERVLLDNAAQDGMFTNDEYIKACKICSLLCLPITHKDELIGLLYLENKHADGVFSANRVRLTELLCSQAAISIQNSKLYNQLQEYSKTLEDKVNERTRELEKVNENLMDINTLLRDARIEAERDMVMASNVQSSFMPKSYSDHSKWDLAYEFRPMTGVSGDFYDFYEINGALRGACLFDVSGHGISSGLITVIARSIIYRYFSQNLDRPLNTVFEEINNTLISEIGHSGNYLTGVMVRFEDDHIEHVNAAHPLAIKYSAKERRPMLLTQEDDSWRGGFLGLEMMRAPFGSLKVPMESGDVIVLFSDCLTEGKNAQREEFGYARIEETLMDSAALGAGEILHSLTEQYVSFVGRESLDDDYTVLVMKKK